jgi:hypothetical protein
MKVYITKYALTSGIFEAEGEVSNLNEKMIVVGKGVDPAYFFRNDWHTDFATARWRAEEMRKTKLVSLKKQLEKYQQLQLDIEPLPWGGKKEKP